MSCRLAHFLLFSVIPRQINPWGRSSLGKPGSQCYIENAKAICRKHIKVTITSLLHIVQILGLWYVPDTVTITSLLHLVQTLGLWYVPDTKLSAEAHAVQCACERDVVRKNKQLYYSKLS